MTISIEEMRSFAAVAAQGTFSAAARALGRSQSVVSTHIAGMENELSIRLFVRGTPAKLTPAGEELLPGALRVLREAERFESRASELFRLPEPLLYMGIDMALELPLLLDLLRDFSRQFPSARLQLENISSSESNWFFRRSHMTMAVIFSSRPDPECEEHLIGLAPRAVVVSKKHPLAAVERPSIVPRAVAMTQPGLRSSLALLSAPFDLPPERLILRTKKDEVPPVFAKWWAAALRKTARRLGLVQPESM